MLVCALVCLCPFGHILVVWSILVKRHSGPTLFGNVCLPQRFGSTRHKGVQSTVTLKEIKRKNLCHLSCDGFRYFTIRKVFFAAQYRGHQFAHTINSPVLDRQRNGNPTITCTEQNITTPYIFGQVVVCILVVLVIISTQVSNDSTKQEHCCHTCESFSRVVFHLSPEVGRTLNCGIPKDISTTSKPRHQCTCISGSCLSSAVIEFCSAAFLVEVYRNLLCIVNGSVNASAHFTRGYESGETRTVLNSPVQFIEEFCKEIPRSLYDYSSIAFLQLAFDIILVLFNISYIGIACFSAVHHKLLEHRIGLVTHIKRTLAIPCQQAFHLHRIYHKVVSVETPSVVRAFLNPRHCVGV